MSIFCSAADVVSTGCRPILFKVLTSNVTICSGLLPLSNFCLCCVLQLQLIFKHWGESSNLSRTHLWFSAWRAMRFGHTMWVKVIITFRWLYFNLINRWLPYGRVAVVSWLNHLILAVDLWGISSQYQVKRVVNPTMGSSALLHNHNATSHVFEVLCMGK